MAKANRDEFSSITKDKAAKRSAYRCAFCGKPTIGPSSESNKSVSNTGVAAHICAAAPGGKRYDSNMTSKQRKSIDNCIWMCQTHAHLIDTDEKTYTVDVLKEMKQNAETIAARANADIRFFQKYYESKHDNLDELDSLLNQMIEEGNFDLLRNTLESYSCTITPLFDEMVCRYRIFYDMYCSNEMLQIHLNQYLSLPIKCGANEIVELFISFNYVSGINYLLEYCTNEDVQYLSSLLIKGELKEKVICSSKNDFRFKCPKGKEALLNKYIICILMEKGIFRVMNSKGEEIFVDFEECYFQLLSVAVKLGGKTLYCDMNYESNPEDVDYNFLVQRIKNIRQINNDAQIFIWKEILKYLLSTPAEFNRVYLEIPVFVRENPAVEQFCWLSKIHNNIETVIPDELLMFSKKNHNYYIFLSYLQLMRKDFQYEYIEDNKYLLKEDSHFLQLYGDNPKVNMSYEDLMKYEQFYRNDFLFHCLCYNYSGTDQKKSHFDWIIENTDKLLIMDLFYYLNILAKESRYDLILEVSRKKPTNDVRLFIANQLLAASDDNLMIEARGIYEDLINLDYKEKGLHSNYAVLLYKQGRFEDAKKHMQKEYDLYKDYLSLNSILWLRYETNSVLDDEYLDVAKSIPTAEYQSLVAISYILLQNKEEAKLYFLRTLLLDDNSKYVGRMFSLTLDMSFDEPIEIREDTVCTLVSNKKTVKIAIHNERVLQGINPNNFADCIHLSRINPLFSSLIYAKVGDVVQFEADSYKVEEISSLWKYLSMFSFSKIINDENTIKINGKRPNEAISKIEEILLNNRKMLDDRICECNNFEICLPLSAFSNQIRKSCLETCEFLARGNSKKIINNTSYFPLKKDNIYVLAFDAVVLLAISGFLHHVLAQPNVICAIQVKKQIDRETSELLNELTSNSSKGNFILVDGKLKVSCLSDGDKRDRYKYLTELKLFAEKKSYAIAYDFTTKEEMLEKIFSSSNTLIESGSLGLVQSIKNSILVTDNQFLYTVADASGLQNVGLCAFISHITDNFTDLIGASKELYRLNFSNYFPFFIFEQLKFYISTTTDQRIKFDNENELYSWLLSDSENQTASEHHANLIIQLFKETLNQDKLILENDDLLQQVALYHFATLHPERIEKVISDVLEDFELQTKYLDENQSE